MQVAMHCIGDRASETAIKAIVAANPNERNPMRHRIIHMQYARMDLVELAARYKIPVECQPGFLLDEWPTYRPHLGPDREKGAQIGQTLIDHNMIFTSSSDAPIVKSCRAHICSGKPPGL
jgi:predicted amidohydrolase YtcJ